MLQALEPVRGPLPGGNWRSKHCVRGNGGPRGAPRPPLERPHYPSPEPPNDAAYQAFWRASAPTGAAINEEALSQFHRAARLDSTYLTAAVWVAMSSWDPSGCAVADSVGRELIPVATNFASSTAFSWIAARACQGITRPVADPESACPGSVAPPTVSNVHGSVHSAGRETQRGGRNPEATRSRARSRMAPRHRESALPAGSPVPYHALGDYRNELRVAGARPQGPEPSRLDQFGESCLAGLGKTSDVLDRLERAWRLPRTR